MFRSYLKLLLRILTKKERLVFGMAILATGFSVSAFVLLTWYVDYEESYDSSFQNFKHIYRVHQNVSTAGSGQMEHLSMIPAKITAQARHELAEVRGMSWISPKLGCSIQPDAKGEALYVENAFLADSLFARLFQLPFTVGDGNHALDDDFSAVISESLAKKAFGSSNAIGRPIKISWGFFEDTFRVKAVFKDLPANSHMAFDVLFSNRQMALQQQDWDYHYTYLMLNQDADVSAAARKVQRIFYDIYGTALSSQNAKVDISLMPVGDIHLRSNFERDIKESSDYRMFLLIRILCTAALFIFVINYINLSSAFYAKRIKEIHLRSSIGATKLMFWKQVMLENFMQLLGGVIVSVAILLALTPYFAHTFHLPVSYGQVFTFRNLVKVILLIFCVSALASLFPVSLFAGVRRVKKAKKKWLLDVRNVFLCLQYVLVGGIIFAMLVIRGQVSYMHQKNLGFEKDRVLFFSTPPLHMTDQEKLAKVKLFGDIVRDVPGVEIASNSLTIPGRFYNNLSSFKREDGVGVNCVGYMANVDYNYLNTFRIKLRSGRDFYPDYNDNRSIIINETLRKTLLFTSPEAAIGKIIKMNDKPYEIAGVINDNHQNSFKSNIQPWGLVMIYKASSFLSVKLRPEYTNETILGIKQAFRQVFPGVGFEYKFMDQYFDRLFIQDDLLQNVFVLFSFVMMVLISIGLFGISSFIISLRTKELAIRKVLGARFAQNILLFSREYLIAIAISGAISLSVCYYYMHIWLNGFAYRTGFAIYYFFIPLLVIAAITFLIVLYNVIRVNVTSPAHVLRTI